MSGSNKPTSKGLVVVTGGSRGIGRSTCLLLASHGYDVVINYRSDRDAAEQVKQTILSDPSTYSGKPLLVKADVSIEEEVEAMFASTTTYFGRNPTGLVNNAGILGEWHVTDVCEMKASDLDTIMAVNVYGPLYCIKNFVKLASTKRGGSGGAIVNVSSGSAHIGRPLLYATSKGALDSMMAGLSKTLPLEGIRINAVKPGMTETDMVSQSMLDNAMPNIPMQRAGRPEEIAEVIYWLLSEGSTYCSGANIRAAGGRP